MLWFEPQGENATKTNATEVTTFSWDVGDQKLGQRAHSSIRRFVIVATDDGHSQCLLVNISRPISYLGTINARRPILTYQRQATTKWGVKPDDHAIIYTGSSAPREIEGEAPLKLRSIRVLPNTPRDKLEKESRINYAKIYTVEHNVKVHFIGHVDPKFQHKFVTDFDATWMKKRQMSPVPQDYSSYTVNKSQYKNGRY